MKSFLKNIWNYFFGETKATAIKEEPITKLKEEKIKQLSPEQELNEIRAEVEKNRPPHRFKPKDKSYLVRNNRLIIHFSRCLNSSRSVSSMRCTKNERAEEIVDQYDDESIVHAIFTDKDGTQFKLV